ncbi:MAG: elongation factor P hydroxylase [Pseudomonadota bacterium]
MIKWTEHLNKAVLLKHGTRLIGGFSEPYYKAAENGSLAQVQFTRDYERSALHELAHWCIAGKRRRLINDYDYWYVPDGRSDEQQQLFFEVEVRPQAVEKYFCAALALPFEVSVDNLGNKPQAGVEAFRARVDKQYRQYKADEFPVRATEIYNCLQQWHSIQSGQNRN